MMEEPEALDKKEDTDLVICIFPHQREFIVIDATDVSFPLINAHIFDVGGIFTQEFYDTLQENFASLLKSKRETPFVGLMELSQEVELLVREQSLSAILKGIRAEKQTNQRSSVSIILCVGPVLSYSQNQIEELLKTALGSKATPESLVLCAQLFEKLREAEKASVGQLQTEHIKDVIEGEADSYFTLWENKS